MKRIGIFLAPLKEQFKKDLTPAKKKEYCEDAKKLIEDETYLNGPWKALAIAMVDALESTIKTV